MKLGILKLEPWFLVGGLEHFFVFPYVYIYGIIIPADYFVSEG
jgi:hypothetical protein